MMEAGPLRREGGGPPSSAPSPSFRFHPSSSCRFAVIFDFDGLIVDSETPEFEAHRQIFAEHGVTLTAEDWLEEVGRYEPDRNWFERLGRRIGRTLDHAALREEKRRRFWQVVLMQPMPGIRRLLDELTAAGVPLALASSSERSWIGRATQMLDVARYFRTIVTGEEVTRRKPDPEPYLLAAQRLGIAPARCVAIEDSEHGLAAARAAGMTTVVIPNWLTAMQDLSAADLRVRSAEELDVGRLARLVNNGSR